MIRDFFLGFIKVHILHHAAEMPVYGAWLIAELAEHGYDLSPGTLYPILHGLEADGLLAHEERVVDGRRRKYYRTTEHGTAELRDIRVKVRELVNEVLDDGRTDRMNHREAFLTPADLRIRRVGADAPLVVDVRTPEEYAAGHVPGAVHVPIDELERRIAELPRDRTVVPYCNMFHPGTSRGERARDTLRAAGLDATTLLGGFPAWREATGEVGRSPVRADDGTDGGDASG